MGLFTAGTRSMSKGQLLEMQYKSARGNLLVAIIFTAVNCTLAALGTTTYFLFSITFPYAMALIGSILTGRMFTLEEMEELAGFAIPEFLPIWMLFVMLIPAVIALVAYLLCWIFSKKHVGWLIAATVLFVIDTLFLIFFYGVDVTMLLDYLFHGWALFLFIRGILAHFKLKEMERENAVVAGTVAPTAEQGSLIDAEADAADVQPAQDQGASVEPDAPAPMQEKSDSPVLHMADYSVKSRTLLEYQIEKYHICYRRVGKVNELVINSMVYDLLDTGHFELPHELCAYLDGHEIAVGYGADSHSYVRFDGEVVKRKIRWI